MNSTRVRWLPTIAMTLVACGDPTAPATSRLPSEGDQLVLAVPATVVLGDTAVLGAEVRSPTGEVRPAAVNWSTPPSAALEVTSDGVLRAIAGGSGEVVASAGALRQTARVKVQGSIQLRRDRPDLQVQPGDVINVDAQISDVPALASRPIRWANLSPNLLDVRPWLVCHAPPDGCTSAPGAILTAMAPGLATVEFWFGVARVQLAIQVTAPPAGPPAGRPEVERFTVLYQPMETPDDRGRSRWYLPLLRVREVTGAAEVYVTDINFTLEGIGAWGAVPPWRVWKPVPKGSAAELIAADAGYGWPEFEIYGREADTVSVVVKYRDASGRRGELAARTVIQPGTWNPSAAATRRAGPPAPAVPPAGQGGQ
jgi:hypothetical protein